MMLKKSVLAMAMVLLSTNLWAGPGHEGHGRLQTSGAGMDHSQMGHGEHGMHGHGAAHALQAGTQGTAEQVDRTISVDALDTMKFEHEPLAVKAGETIRFDVTNQGQVVHEFAIGSKGEHAKHRIQMREMPDMKHEDLNVVTLEPGERKSLVWTFANAEEIQVACNIPGHYEAGMYSQVDVQ